MDRSRPKLDLRGAFAVPSLARKSDSRRTLDLAESARLVHHIAQGGITRFIYGGNAFLYHLTLVEYEVLLNWLDGFPGDLCMVPSAGPSYGRAMDQAPLLKRHDFPCVMMLPCNDPRDAAGLEAGLREFADAAETPLLLYLKDERNFGADLMAGLDAVARMVQDGTCIAIKYAVVRTNPARGTARTCGPEPSPQRHGGTPGGVSPARLEAARFHHGLWLRRAAVDERALRSLLARRLFQRRPLAVGIPAARRSS